MRNKSERQVYEKAVIKFNILDNAQHEDIIAFVELVESLSEGKVEKYKILMKPSLDQGGKAGLYIRSRAFIAAGAGEEEIKLAVKELALEKH